MTESPTKSELLTEIEAEWAYIERICASLSEADMVAPGIDGGWSVKDTLCHLSAWEKYLLERLGYTLTGQKPVTPAMYNWDDVDSFNAQVFDQNKDRPLNSVIIEFRSLYRGVMTVLESMDDEQLRMAYSYDFPEDSLTLLRLIRANTCVHYREHRRAFDKGK